MQKANPHWPFRIRRPRRGADPAFAKAMARSEFGRFYTDDSREREVRRSLARAKAPEKKQAPLNGPLNGKNAGPPAEPAKKGKAVAWRQHSVRE